MPKRRLLQLVITGTTYLCTGAALVVVAAGMLRLALNDSLWWAQYLYWVPAVALLAPAVALWVAASLLGIAWRALGKRAQREPAMRLRIVTGVGCALLGLHLALVDYRLYNLIVPRGGGPSIRVLHWNASGVSSLDGYFDAVLAQDADVSLAVDVCCSSEWAPRAQERAPGMERLVNSNMRLLSRFAIVRWGHANLGIPAPEPRPDADREQRRALRWLGDVPLLRHAALPDGLRPLRDPGRAWYFELDTREVLGRTTIVWLVDLPSDIRLARQAVTGHAMDVIRTWTGDELVLAPEGVARRAAGPGFPAPDLIVGDFNIPRGSRSLRTVTLGYPHAHSQAGHGHAGTYPRHRQLVHIDNMYVGPRLRAARYETVDPGVGSHRLQVGEVGVRR